MTDARINKTVRMRVDQVEALEGMMDDETTFSALVRKAIDELLCRQRVAEDAPNYTVPRTVPKPKRTRRRKK